MHRLNLIVLVAVSTGCFGPLLAMPVFSEELPCKFVSAESFWGKSGPRGDGVIRDCTADSEEYGAHYFVMPPLRRGGVCAHLLNKIDSYLDSNGAVKWRFSGGDPLYIMAASSGACSAVDSSGFVETKGVSLGVFDVFSNGWEGVREGTSGISKYFIMKSDVYPEFKDLVRRARHKKIKLFSIEGAASYGGFGPTFQAIFKSEKSAWMVVFDIDRERVLVFDVVELTP